MSSKALLLSFTKRFLKTPMTSNRKKLIRDKRLRDNASNKRNSRDSKRKRQRREERKPKLRSHQQVHSREESLPRLYRVKFLISKRRRK